MNISLELHRVCLIELQDSSLTKKGTRRSRSGVSRPLIQPRNLAIGYLSLSSRLQDASYFPVRPAAYHRPYRTLPVRDLPTVHTFALSQRWLAGNKGAPAQPRVICGSRDTVDNIRCLGRLHSFMVAHIRLFRYAALIRII